jgi:hypothetical protein
MASSSFRTQLCVHCPGHRHSACGWAHSLLEVVAPPQGYVAMYGWSRVHFYVGQTWDYDIIQLFQRYVELTRTNQLPSWAIPAIWLFYSLPLLWQPFHGDDFLTSHRAASYNVNRPILSQEFSTKIRQRKDAMAQTSVYAACMTHLFPGDAEYTMRTAREARDFAASASPGDAEYTMRTAREARDFAASASSSSMGRPDRHADVLLRMAIPTRSYSRRDISSSRERSRSRSRPWL